MATPATGARAARRAASTAARSKIDAQPAPTLTANDAVSPAEAQVQDDIDAAAEEAFGSEDLSPSIGQIVDAVKQGNGTVIDARPVAPRVSIPLAVAPPVQEDLTRQITAGDLIIPKLQLSQAMSKVNMTYQSSKGTAGVQQGHWYHSTSGEDLGEMVYFIPADMRKSRAYFVQGSGLMCRSFDLLNGEGDPGGSCEGSYEERLTMPADRRGCPLRLWTDNQPPKCGQTYNFPGLIIRESEIENPAKAKPITGMLRFRSTATQAAKALITQVMENGGAWSGVILELGVDIKTNPRGTFYAPTVDFYDTTDAEGFERIARRAASMSRQMGSANLRSSIEDDDTVS